jgi:hypothetical protein
LLSAAGVLVATAVPNPTAAGQVVVLEFVVESFIPGDRVGRYLPFGLVDALFGSAGHLHVLPALALLIGYVGVLYLAVRRWALGRDLA